METILLVSVEMSALNLSEDAFPIASMILFCLFKVLLELMYSRGREAELSWRGRIENKALALHVVDPGLIPLHYFSYLGHRRRTKL